MNADSNKTFETLTMDSIQLNEIIAGTTGITIPTSSVHGDGCTTDQYDKDNDYLIDTF